MLVALVTTFCFVLFIIIKGKITAQGKLLLHGLLMCSEVMAAAGAKAKELQVFLFEQNIIFSEAVGKKTQFTDPMYIYKAHIQVREGKGLDLFSFDVCQKLKTLVWFDFF